MLSCKGRKLVYSWLNSVLINFRIYSLYYPKAKIVHQSHMEHFVPRREYVDGYESDLKAF
jgi:hypothetical protein